MNQIRNLMVFAAMLVLAIIYSEEVFSGIVFLLNILKPFLYGGVIAFVLNILMRMVEEKFLRKWKGRAAARLKRPASIAFSIMLIVLVITIVVRMVLPQMALTVSEIGNRFPVFIDLCRLFGAFLILINNPGNLIYPRVVGSSVGLPSIWILMAVSVGGSLFGVIGMLVFIPLMSTGYALLKENVDQRTAAKAETRALEKGELEE